MLKKTILWMLLMPLISGSVDAVEKMSSEQSSPTSTIADERDLIDIYRSQIKELKAAIQEMEDKVDAAQKPYEESDEGIPNNLNLEITMLQSHISNLEDDLDKVKTKLQSLRRRLNRPH